LNSRPRQGADDTLHVDIRGHSKERDCRLREVNKGWCAALRVVTTPRPRGRARSLEPDNVAGTQRDQTPTSLLLPPSPFGDGTSHWSNPTRSQRGDSKGGEWREDGKRPSTEKESLGSCPDF
jgi:hypothetical protein